VDRFTRVGTPKYRFNYSRAGKFPKKRLLLLLLLLYIIPEFDGFFRATILKYKRETKIAYDQPLLLGGAGIDFRSQRTRSSGRNRYLRRPSGRLDLVGPAPRVVSIAPSGRVLSARACVRARCRRNDTCWCSVDEY